MTWTIDRPTTPGWYWLKNPPDSDAVPVEVWEFEGEFWVSYSGTESDDRLLKDVFDDVRWYGPITPPSEG
jgi:hypothetical protein